MEGLGHYPLTACTSLLSAFSCPQWSHTSQSSSQPYPDLLWGFYVANVASSKLITGTLLLETRNFTLWTWVVPSQLSSEVMNSLQNILLLLLQICHKIPLKATLSSAVASCLGKRGAHPSGGKEYSTWSLSGSSRKCWSRGGVQAVLSVLWDSNWSRNEVTKGLGIGHKMRWVNTASLLTSNNSGIVWDWGYIRKFPQY